MKIELIGENKKNPVAAPEPYPAVAVHTPNRRLVQLIQQDIAYSKGEMSAVCQYLYHHWMLNGSYPEMASTLLRIAEVEMRHLQILGELVRAAGGDPRFCCVQKNSCQCWSGNMIHYGGNVRQMLKWDLVSERDTADLYESQARFVKDENAAAILSRLAVDERLHCQILEHLLVKLPEGKTCETPPPIKKKKV